jgi:asparagine synthetase B (glutamine-hydrolysing)
LLGLYGAIDLGGTTCDRLSRLGVLMRRQLGASGPELDFGGCAVVGRTGAGYQHSSAWPPPDRRCAVAGILHTPPSRERDIDPNAIEGFFAALARQTDGGLALITDRRGSIPVYFASHDDCIVFAPTVRAVVCACPDMPRDLDLASLGCLLSSGHLLGDQTLLRSVRRLRGGQVLRVTKDKWRIETYGRFQPGCRSHARPEGALADELMDRVQFAVARNLREPEQTFIFLSGGADSRGLLAAALKTVPRQQITAVTWSSDSGTRASDLDIARQAADLAKVRHTVLQYAPGIYADRFAEANSVIDALTDSAAFHPNFLSTARAIAELSLQTGLRGDEAFGWWHPVRTVEEAMLAVGLRTIEQAGVGSLLRPELRPQVTAAQSQALDHAAGELAGLTPDQMKDGLYFEHRLQCYLGVENRLRQTVLDHRNPFLDESILAFMEEVPDRWRAHKLLYQRAMARRYPQLWEIGIAGQLSTENWSGTFARKPDIREFISAELADHGSAIWCVLDRQFLLQTYERLSADRTHAPATWKSIARSMLRTVRPLMPAGIAKLGAGRIAARATAPHRLIMRALVLKHWFDAYRPSTPT